MTPPTHPGSPETALLLACARNRLDSRTAEHIKTLVEGEIDWALLVRRAISHALTPLLAWNLTQACSGSLPLEIRDALVGSLEQNRQRSLALAREVLTVVELLRTRDIPAIPIKGPVLAKRLYGDLALRQSGDLDFLVCKRHVSKAVNLLGCHGYVLGQQLRNGQDAAYRRYYPAYDLYSKDKSIMTEVHWSLTPRIMAVPFDSAGLWERARPIDFEGQPVLSLSTEDYLLFLCVHGSKHLWARLNWTCDIHEFLSAHPGIDWTRCLERAGKQGCERMLLLGMTLASDLLETKLPAPVEARIQSDLKVRTLAEEIQTYFLQDRERPPNVFEAFRPFLALRERWRDKAAYCWRNVTTPRVNHLGIVSLPRSLWFLYVPIKLLYDYGWRPFKRPGRLGRHAQSEHPDL